jgi:hypothetical protein
MKPHPRIRKTIKWGGAAVTLLLVVAWIGSGRWRVVYCGGRTYSLRHGCVYVDTLQAWESPYWSPGWHVDGGGQPMEWWFQIGSHAWYGGPGHVSAPLWTFAALAALVTGMAWRLEAAAHRRARVGLCPKCNYDRAGIAKDAVCPECGSAGGAA